MAVDQQGSDGNLSKDTRDLQMSVDLGPLQSRACALQRVYPRQGSFGFYCVLSYGTLCFCTLSMVNTWYLSMQTFQVRGYSMLLHLVYTVYNKQKMAKRPEAVFRDQCWKAALSGRVKRGQQRDGRVKKKAGGVSALLQGPLWEMVA